nr:MAG TPA: hypothetical protein [Caudoviricetes sp.]
MCCIPSGSAGARRMTALSRCDPWTFTILPPEAR